MKVILIMLVVLIKNGFKDFCCAPGPNKGWSLERSSLNENMVSSRVL